MTTPPSIHVDLEQTQRRITQLRRYVEDNLLREGEFVCSHENACRASIDPFHVFREGTMSHVGHRFDLRIGDKPLRVVVVGQEVADRKVTMDVRYRHIHDESGLQKRYYANAGHPARNPHMRGTTSALRVLFGKGLGADHEGEWVYPANGEPFHIFDGFALVNRLLCFAGPPGSKQGRATKTMLSNCGEHITATMLILQPTILILQGGKAATWSKTALTRGRRHSFYLYEAHLGEDRMVVCEFSHPSAREPDRWGANLDAFYLKSIVEPNLREALRLS
jgi:hypothetical protein